MQRQGMLDCDFLVKDVDCFDQKYGRGVVVL